LQTIEDAASQRQRIAAGRAIDAWPLASSDTADKLVQLLRQLIAIVAIQLLHLHMPAE
jgi:hypothetical protein